MAVDRVRVVSGEVGGSYRLMWLHRLITLAAIGSLFVGLRTIWMSAITDAPGFGVLASFCYLALIVLAIAAACVRTGSALVQVDLAVLVVAILTRIVAFHQVFTGDLAYPVDEGALLRQAMVALAHGHNPYAGRWPAAVQPVPTQLFNGGIVDRLGYPPLSVVLGVAAGGIYHGFQSPVFVSGLALIVTGIVCFFCLPAPARPLATLVVFGLDLSSVNALHGYASVLALPFLVIVIWRWPTIGVTGRLGRGGVVRAICLGLACAAQQLPWFVVPFLIVGMLRLRSAELGRRDGGLVVARYAGIAGAVFTVINLPFIVASPSQWASGISSVVTQHAVLYGQGVVTITMWLIGGSGEVAFYSYASMLLLLGLLAVFALWPAALARALVVLPSLVFLLSDRSLEEYCWAFIPVWLIGAVSVFPDDFAAVSAVRLPRLAWRRRVVTPAVVVVSALAPSLACATVAVASSQPLSMHVVQDTVSTSGRITAVRATVRNTSGHVVRPHFAMTSRGELTAYWIVKSGLPLLAPKQSAIYVLATPGSMWSEPVTEPVRLAALSDDPETFSTTRIPGTHAAVGDDD